MKFASNNPRKFNSSTAAFVTGLLQGSAVLGVEILSVTVCLTSTQVLDVVMNFIALAVIADFDDFIYGAIRNENIKDLIENDEVKEEAEEEWKT